MLDGLVLGVSILFMLGCTVDIVDLLVTGLLVHTSCSNDTPAQGVPLSLGQSRLGVEIPPSGNLFTTILVCPSREKDIRLALCDFDTTRLFWSSGECDTVIEPGGLHSRHKIFQEWLISFLTQVNAHNVAQSLEFPFVRHDAFTFQNSP